MPTLPAPPGQATFRFSDILTDVFVAAETGCVLLRMYETGLLLAGDFKEGAAPANTASARGTDRRSTSTTNDARVSQRSRSLSQVAHCLQESRAHHTGDVGEGEAFSGLMRHREALSHWRLIGVDFDFLAYQAAAQAAEALARPHGEAQLPGDAMHDYGRAREAKVPRHRACLGARLSRMRTLVERGFAQLLW